MKQRSIRQVAFLSENQVGIETRELIPPATNEVQVETARTLISAGTELDYLNGTLPGRLRPEVTFPIYHGYSNVGRAIAVGSDVTEVRVGERVLTTGPHASHFNVKADTAIRIPPEVSDEAATFAVLGSVALHGIRRAPLELGDSALIVGDGLLGQLTAQLARLQGAYPVVLVGHHRRRLVAAHNGGATDSWDERETDVVAAFQNLTGGRLADIVFETAGRVEALELAFKAARVAGTVVLLGGIRRNVTFDPSIFYHQFLIRDLTLMAASQSIRPETESNYFHWPQKRNRSLILNLQALGTLKVEHLITHHFPADDAKQAYQLLSGQRDLALGVILDWG